jgi:hypothetical protein
LEIGSFNNTAFVKKYKSRLIFRPALKTIYENRRKEMLELRPFCECCAKTLPPDSTDALICSFECTFCADCAENVLDGICPNCGGDLKTRPSRHADLLIKNPASTGRIVKENGCLQVEPAVCTIAV